MSIVDEEFFYNFSVENCLMTIFFCRKSRIRGPQNWSLESQFWVQVTLLDSFGSGYGYPMSLVLVSLHTFFFFCVTKRVSLSWLESVTSEMTGDAIFELSGFVHEDFLIYNFSPWDGSDVGLGWWICWLQISSFPATIIGMEWYRTWNNKYRYRTLRSMQCRRYLVQYYHVPRSFRQGHDTSCGGVFIQARMRIDRSGSGFAIFLFVDKITDNCFVLNISLHTFLYCGIFNFFPLFVF